MSATLDAAPIAEYLRNCPVIRSEGKLFDVTVSYTPHSSASARAAGRRRASEDRGRRRCACLSTRSCRNSPRASGMRSSGPYPQSPPDSALRRPVAGRAGSRSAAGGSTKSNSVNQRRRKLDHHRGSYHGHRQRFGAHCRRFTLDRPADIECAAHRQSFRYSEGRPSRTNASRSRDPPLFIRGFSTPARSRCCPRFVAANSHRSYWS